MAPVERLVNLALLLAASQEPLTADRIRSEGIYPAEQESAAFLRMFERDKDELRAMGFAIDADDSGAYRLDAGTSFASAIELTSAETAALRVAGSALAGDPSFPFADDLRLALAKLAADTSTETLPTSARLADEEPDRQGSVASTLVEAASARKTAHFDYTNSFAKCAEHTVEPYGLFVHDGRWYLVGRDVAKDEVRTYAVTRIDALRVNPSRPRTPDFDRPDGFDVGGYVRLPFQYGTQGERFDATVVFDAPIAWRAAVLSGGIGRLDPLADGSVEWRVTVSSADRFMRFVIENGPGLRIAAPHELALRLQSALASVEVQHG